MQAMPYQEDQVRPAAGPLPEGLRGWTGTVRSGPLAVNHEWASEFLRPFGIEFDRQNTARSDFQTAA